MQMLKAQPDTAVMTGPDRRDRLPGDRTLKAVHRGLLLLGGVLADAVKLEEDGHCGYR